MKADLALLEHEFAELLIMGKQNIDYQTAHAIVHKYFNWQSLIIKV